ncbi:DUF938 domain-containing protein [Roseomonas elaeocarpi]|uniref:DUF938 domain-containing protein n=1 Tax=Roseomonas elaeocarpi TaxID=907779 RepID=A0ABV6JQQ2_9PROT
MSPDATPWLPAEAPSEDARRHAPAALRNRDPILEVLRRVLPATGTLLEVASGSGEHALHFARALPGLRFQPSDMDPAARASIDAWARTEVRPNLLPALALDASAAEWPVGAADAVLCLNMVHIAPWEATLGLLRGAARLLAEGSPLVLYGPYRRRGEVLAPSNEAFDQSLRTRDPRWGLRELEAVAEAASGYDLRLDTVEEMPANNLLVVFRRFSP